MSKERLEYVKEYYQKQKHVTVQLPSAIRVNGNKTIATKFNGHRCGYKFVDGIVKNVKREDVYTLQLLYPDLIVIEE
ncbi:hypothetical protein [Priestia abyssalis]|uniref:hypothetical protein n=1 Tax=Priestia abyssalis TaxID=1221450 RepID=UPI000995ADA0|nr:hypothetical protein [Priestia abyssalis]